jgi:hypothetical protein
VRKLRQEGPLARFKALIKKVLFVATGRLTDMGVSNKPTFLNTSDDLSAGAKEIYSKLINGTRDPQHSQKSSVKGSVNADTD